MGGRNQISTYLHPGQVHYIFIKYIYYVKHRRINDVHTCPIGTFHKIQNNKYGNTYP